VGERVWWFALTSSECRLGLEAFDTAGAADDLVAAILRH
jgi:hypothetical protein